MCVCSSIHDSWSKQLKPVFTGPVSPRSISVLGSAASSTSVDASDGSSTPLEPACPDVAFMLNRAKELKLGNNQPGLAQRPAQRAVHKLAPLRSLSDLKGAGTATYGDGGDGGGFKTFWATERLHASEEKFGSPTDPIPIPGGIKAAALQRQTNLIKAVPAGSPLLSRVKIGEAPLKGLPRKAAKAPLPPEGSWTKRQMRFPPDEPARQPPGLDRGLQVRNAAVRARVAKHASIAARKECPPQDAAWRYRFKRKWIREELLAYRMDFPDDPSYDDAWADAAGFIEAHGAAAALQAAFLETPAKCAEDELDDESSDSILFGSLDSADEAPRALQRGAPSLESAPVGVAAKAAFLVKLQQRAEAA